MKKHAVYYFILMLLGLVAYYASLGGPFLFDDVPAIVHNPFIRSLWPITEAMKAPLDTTVSSRPVVSLSLALSYAVAGLQVWPYHVFNGALHLINAWLLFAVLKLIFTSPRLSSLFSSVAAPLAFISAVLWLVHPLNSQPVLYLVQRAELLLAFFLLLSLYASIRFIRAPGKKRWAGLAVFACLLGMGSKETMVTAPVLILLCDAAFFEVKWTVLFRRRKFFYACLFATALIPFVLLGADPHGSAAGVGLPGIPWWRYAITQWEVILHYLRLLVWPVPLCFYYAWPLADSLRSVAVPGAIVGALLLATILGWRRHRSLSFVGLWFFVLLAPTSSIVVIASEVAAERRMYLPSMALIAGLVAIVWLFFCASPLQKHQRAIRSIAVALTGAVMGTFIMLTQERVRVFSSAESVWADVVRQQPHSVKARKQLGMALMAEERLLEAREQFLAVQALEPSNTATMDNIAKTYFDLEEYAQAEAWILQTYQNEPRELEFIQKLVRVLLAQNKQEEAIRHLENFTERVPDQLEAWNVLGVLHAQHGNYQRACECFYIIVKQNRNIPDAVNNLRETAERLGYTELFDWARSQASVLQSG